MPVATVNEVCEDIIKKVCSSNLTYQINQTPYSLYFTIRKKFVKEFDPNSSSSTSNPLEALVNENNYVRSEYNKLLALYLDTKAKLDEETQRVKAEESQPPKDDTKEKLEVEIKAIRNEKKIIVKKNENLISDSKRLKEEISDLKKDKNALSVAVKTCKKEQSEQFKRTALKINDLEKKIVALTEYKNKQLSEDRELKIREKKELKKANKLKIKSPETKGFGPHITNNNVTSIPSSSNTTLTTNTSSESNIDKKIFPASNTSLVSSNTTSDTSSSNTTSSSSSSSANSEAKIMTDEEFNILLSNHFNPTVSSTLSKSISVSVQEAFAKFEKKLDKAEKVLDDYLEK